MYFIWMGWRLLQSGLESGCWWAGWGGECAGDGMIDSFLDDVRADVETEFHDKGYVWPPKIPALLNEIKTMLTDEGLNKHQRMVDKINTALEQLNNKNDN